MPELQLYWGEIHNHNELGYAQGSLERSYEIARSHLDFYAFTPHGLHADGGTPDGFPVVNENWDRIQRAAADNNVPGEFTCFLGYEWHSHEWGHLWVVSSEVEQPMYCARTLADLQDHFRGTPTILGAHHTAYDGGVDWENFDEELCPVVEIFSEHGCSERDIGAFPMLGHSGGPGAAGFTLQQGLACGRRFGFSAGTDTHDGYPGAYGQGLTGVWANENTREGILEALRSRRCTAVTGDRIAVEFCAGDAPMGSSIEADEPRDLTYRVQGWDFIKQVELVRDNVPIQVETPDYGAPNPTGEQLYRLRLEWGWGPMKGYQVFDWQGSVRIDAGRLEQVVPCFTSDPFDEHRRKRVLTREETGCTWQSHTSRGGMLTSRNGFVSASANDALCLEVRGNEETQLNITFGCETHTSLVATMPDWTLSPSRGTLERSMSIGELLNGRQGFRMEGAPTWVVAHRAVPPSLYTIHGGHSHAPGDGSFYYLRVTQENGQMAWASPVWMGRSQQVIGR